MSAVPGTPSIAYPAHKPRHPAVTFLVQQPLGAAGLAVIVLMILAALGAKWVAPYDPLTIEYANILARPSWEHWLGTDKEIMEIGRRCKIPFDNVLPYMGIDTHSYCVFVYEELYCQGKITVKEAIEAFKMSMDDDDNLLSKFVQFVGEYNLQINFEIYFRLHQMQIPFIEAYLQHEIDIRSRNAADNKDWHKLFAKGKGLPFIISIRHFFIFKLECYEHGNDCFLNIIFEGNNDQWYGIILYCTRDTLNRIFSHCRFHTHSSLIRANLSENVLALNFQKDFPMRNIEIIELPLQLKMIIEEDTGSPTNGYYTINDPEENIFSQYGGIIDPELPF